MSGASLQALAFAITSAWEGGSYAAYQNEDDGIVSYGRFQFTLASGSLQHVIELYLQKRSVRLPPSMFFQYLDRIRAKDPALRHDDGFKEALHDASTLDIMHEAQDEAATALYWDPMMERMVKPFKLTLPLSIAYCFDTAIQLGPRNENLAKALRDLGGQATEQALITRAVQRRRDELYAQAEREHLEGLKWRGAFWLKLCTVGDWNLRGENGKLPLKPGLTIRIPQSI